MRIHPSIHAAYVGQRPIYELLSTRVTDELRPECIKRRWHYESRIKEEASVALKIETGRVKNLENIEDFFACTIVVKNSSEISDALALVRRVFTIRYRRPQNPTETRKQPSAFIFDDLRLYCTMKREASLPPSPLITKVFEIQIKTFLLHAWSIATHDLTYKTDDVSWGKERIAFQLRAMLEHAELSLLEAEKLATSTVLALTNKESEELRETIRLLQNNWPTDLLPDDLKRAAISIGSVISAVGVTRDRLQELLTAEQARNGSMPLSETPYGVCMRLLVQNEPDRMQTFLSKPAGVGPVLVLDGNQTWPAWMPVTERTKVFLIS